MPSRLPSVTEELLRLVTVADERRAALQSLADRSERVRKALVATSGTLFVVSGALQSAVVVQNAPSLGLSVAALVLTVAAGILSVVSSLRLSPMEYGRIRAGSSQFLVLREQATQALTNMAAHPRLLAERYQELNDRYCALSSEYGGLAPRHRLMESATLNFGAAAIEETRRSMIRDLKQKEEQRRADFLEAMRALDACDGLSNEDSGTRDPDRSRQDERS